MPHLLIRDLSPGIYCKLRKLAHKQNMSLSQEASRLIADGLEKEEKKNKDREEELDVFERIRRFREKMAKKYGKQEDSVKWIREDRDSH